MPLANIKIEYITKGARKALNIGEVWNLHCRHGNKTIKLILWSTFSRILLQTIKDGPLSFTLIILDDCWVRELKRFSQYVTSSALLFVFSNKQPSMAFEYLSFLIEVSDVIIAISCLANFQYISLVLCDRLQMSVLRQSNYLHRCLI